MKSPRLSLRVSCREEMFSNLRMAMRLVEMTERVLARDLPWADEFALRMIRAHYMRRIYQVLSSLPPEMADEILVASEKTIGLLISYLYKPWTMCYTASRQGPS